MKRNHILIYTQNIYSSCAQFCCNTLDLNVDSVMVVLDAVLDLTAVDPRVVGAHL